MSKLTAFIHKITVRTQLGSFFQIDQLTALHLALQRRLIRRAIEAVRGDLAGIDLAHVEADSGFLPPMVPGRLSKSWSN